ncbi:hypothetical protein C7M41_01192 [Pediococcus acidilactici]|nr:hypothetical protein C7M41_01192 [Pediococcus acidilactici]QHM55149.1 hypothetical protein C7M42_01906 [Pediococcus acidilactici]
MLEKSESSPRRVYGLATFIFSDFFCYNQIKLSGHNDWRSFCLKTKTTQSLTGMSSFFIVYFQQDYLNFVVGDILGTYPRFFIAFYIVFVF